MKRKIYALICVISISLGAISCAETPKEEVVVNKSQGIPRESILKKDDKPKDLQIPEIWQEEIKKSDGFITLSADCSLKISDIYNTPVDSYEQSKMNNEILKKLCNYFSNKDQLYEYPKMTKEELELEKRRMKNYEGTWAAVSDGLGTTKYWQDTLERMNELIEKAPEKEEKKRYIKATLMKPVQTERDYYDGVSDYYYETNEKIGFTARIDRKSEKDPLIRAVSYCDKAGSTSNFRYSQGTFIDEEYLASSMQDNVETTEKKNAWLKELEKNMSASPEISEEEALKEAEDVLKNLKITGFKVDKCVKAIGNKNTETWVLWDNEHPFDEVGYSIYFYRTLENLVGYEPESPEIIEDVPETVYAPQFSVEKIQMIITKDGIQKFVWTNISKKTGTIAENTKLLSFGEIKEKLADHLLYTVLAENGDAVKNTGTKYVYNVTDVQLRAANINAFEEPKKVWMVPVWVFDLMQTGITPDGENLKWGTKTVVLNAIDGGFITIKSE